MPAQAVALKEYRSGRAPRSKMADNEDALPSLCDAEVLSVKNSVGKPIPDDPQEPEEGTKVPSSVA
jgi:hypothetical protein